MVGIAKENLMPAKVLITVLGKQNFSRSWIIRALNEGKFGGKLKANWVVWICLFRQLPFAFNFPSSPVTRPTVYNAKVISQKKKIHLFGKFRVAKFQFALNFSSLMWVTYDGYNHGFARRRSWFRQAVWWGSLLWNIEEGCKSPLILTDKMTLFPAHTLFPELLYFQDLPFVSGAHNKMHKFLEIVALMRGNRAKALGIYCHH